MGKNKTSDADSISTKGKASKGRNGGGATVSQSPTETIDFPRIASSSSGKVKARTLRQPTVLVPDQVLLYPDALTSTECDAVIAMFTQGNAGSSTKDGLTMQPSPPARKGEAQRTNARFSTVSPSFAQQLYEQTGIQDAVKDWPSMFSATSGARPKALSSNIRVYRYEPGDIFGCHYDDHSTDPHFGPSFGKTEWTVLFYLTGEPDVQGGQTVFYKTHTRPKEGLNATDKAVVAPLQKGAALLHRHGKVCMLHEALPPTRGTKWVLRSDLIFGPPS